MTCAQDDTRISQVTVLLLYIIWKYRDFIFLLVQSSYVYAPSSVLRVSSQWERTQHTMMIRNAPPMNFLRIFHDPIQTLPIQEITQSGRHLHFVWIFTLSRFFTIWSLNSSALSVHKTHTKGIHCYTCVVYVYNKTRLYDIGCQRRTISADVRLCYTGN